MVTMKSIQDTIGRIRIRFVAVAVSIAFALVGATLLASRSADHQKVSGIPHSSKRMQDRKQWMTNNLNVHANPSYCYDDAELNCRQYGRLYTWESAQTACRSLGEGWRLPTDDEWRQMAKHYGG